MKVKIPWTPYHLAEITGVGISFGIEKKDLGDPGMG